MRSTYRPILKQALKIAWHNPWLWFFGLFAVLLGGSGEFNILVNNFSAIQEGGLVITELRDIFAQGAIGAWLATAVEVLDNLNPVSVIVLLLLLVVFLFVLWLAVVCQGGLVSGLFRRHRGQLADFSESWRRGLSKFWPVLWLNLVGRLTTYVALVVIGLPLFLIFVATNALIWQLILLFVSFIILIPFAIIVAFLVKYAVISVVVKNNDFILAIKESWRIFKKNWIVSVEMALILYLINIAFGLGVILALTIIAMPFLIVGFVFYSLQIAPALWLIAIVGLLVLVVVLFILGAIFSSFQIGVWVILYAQLTQGVVLPKVLRLAATLTGRRKEAAESE